MNPRGPACVLMPGRLVGDRAASDGAPRRVARATRCCSPRDVSLGYREPSSPSPNAWMRSSIRSRRSVQRTRHPRRVLHVLPDRELLHQTEMLRQAPRSRTIPAGAVTGRLDLPLVRQLPTGRDVQQGRSCPTLNARRARRPRPRVPRVLTVAKRVHGLVPLTVRLVDAAQPQHGLRIEQLRGDARVRPAELRTPERSFRRGTARSSAVPLTRPCSSSNRSSAIAITAGSCVAEQERHTLTGQGSHPIEHDVARGIVELRGGFVGDDDVRAGHQGLGERRPLLLPAGELGRQVIDPTLDAEEFEESADVEPPDPGPFSGETQMLSDRQVGEEVVGRPLVDVADEVPPEPAPRGRGPSTDVAALDVERARSSVGPTPRSVGAKTTSRSPTDRRSP